MRNTNTVRAHRHAPLASLLLVAGLALLALAPAARAEKVVTDALGPVGHRGGETFNPQGIAINQTGAGGVAPGTIYVLDGNEGGAKTELNRVQRLTPDGQFERAWGFNVSGPDERQEITIEGVNVGTTGGTFTLSFEGETTKALFSNSSAAAIATALAELPAVGAGNVIHTNSSAGTGQTVRFTGALSGTDVPQLTIDGSALKGPSPSASVTTVEEGAGGSFTGFEICTVAAECQGNPLTQATANGGQLNDPEAIAVSQSSGDVYVTNTGNRRVEQYDADGNFIRTWGWDVVSSGGTGDVSENAFEICTVAGDCKQGAPAGADGGRFNGGRSYIQVDSSDNVWVGDGGSNRRFQEFDASGNFIAAYGWNVDALGGSGELETCASTAPGACQAGTQGEQVGQFGSLFSPTTFTLDAGGALFANDAQNDRILRFDPGFPSASVFGDFGSEESELPSLGLNEALLALPGDHLLVGVPESDGNQLIELDTGGEAVETALTGAGIKRISGLARNESTGTIYATTSNRTAGLNGVANGPGILLIDEGTVAPPAATMDPITVFDESSASFSGTVDPEGLLIGACKFEYSLDQVAWIDAPAAGCHAFDPEGGPQAVNAEVKGLEPGTDYYVRLVATRPYNPAATATSGEEEFTALSLPPIISGTGAVRIADSSAYLTATVKPRSQLTEYRFEYGTTPALGSSTPSAEIEGSAERPVALRVEGLQPATIYHLKLVATNVAGTSEGEVVTFTTRSEPLPEPETRAYEQVSPTEKNFNEVGYQGAPRIAEDGQAATFPVVTSIETAPTQVWFIAAPVLSRRGADGWQERAIVPPNCYGEPGNPETTGQGSAASDQNLSADLDRAVLKRSEMPECPVAPLDPAAPPQPNLYLADLAAESPGHRLLTPQPAIGSVGPHFAKDSDNVFRGGDGSWERLFYTSNRQMTADAPAGEFSKLFEWHDGELSLVSKGPAGTPLTSASSLAGDEATHTVSEDGKRVFFTSPTSGSGQELYLRQGGVLTYDVSESECTSSCGASAADRFRWATPNGSRVLFSSEAKLTDDAATGGRNLYLYIHSANPTVNQNLTLLSKDNEPADGSTPSALGVLGMSDDGASAYFAASGQLVAGASSDDGVKLYRWTWSGGVSYLGTIKADETGNWGSTSTRPAVRRVTRDGETLLVETAARLEALADTDTTTDVYRWREAEGWQCVSCQLPGVASAGTASFAGAGAEVGLGFGNAMSADGRRIFFTAKDALLGADTNEKRDLYEWHEGKLGLVSSGGGTADVKLAGIGVSGEDVFFVTRERLVGWDTDESSDLYDARIGGGFAEPPPEPVPCEGEGCRGASSTAPTSQGAGTAAFEGPGNIAKSPSRRRCPKGKRKVRRKDKVRCVKRKRQGKRHHRKHRRTAKHNRRNAR